MNPDKHRILVVDDQSYNRTILVSGLGEMGYQVEEASNGKDALEVALAIKPHVVLMDIDMPVMNGLDATHQIHIHPALQNTKVIMVTANDHIYEFNRALECGAVDYVVKPILLTHVAQLIERYISDSP